MDEDDLQSTSKNNLSTITKTSTKVKLNATHALPICFSHIKMKTSIRMLFRNTNMHMSEKKIDMLIID